MARTSSLASAAPSACSSSSSMAALIAFSLSGRLSVMNARCAVNSSDTSDISISRAGSEAFGRREGVAVVKDGVAGRSAGRGGLSENRKVLRRLHVGDVPERSQISTVAKVLAVVSHDGCLHARCTGGWAMLPRNRGGGELHVSKARCHRRRRRSHRAVHGCLPVTGGTFR